MTRFFKRMFSGWPATIAGVSAVAWLVLGWSVIGVLGILVGVAWALYLANAKGTRLIEEVAITSDALGEGGRAELESLERDLKATARNTSLQAVSMQASDQFRGVHEKYLNFKEVLERRFDPGELTYGRYLGSGEQVYLSIIDDLGKASTMLKGISSIDLDQVRAQLRILKRREEPSETDRLEVETLEERQRLHEEKLDGVKALLASNEQAITRLVEAATAVAEVQTSEGLSALDTSTAMAQLEELARRSEKYSV